MHIHAIYRYIDHLARLNTFSTTQRAPMLHLAQAGAWEYLSRGNHLRWHALLQTDANDIPVYFDDCMAELEELSAGGDADLLPFAWVAVAFLVNAATFQYDLGDNRMTTLCNLFDFSRPGWSRAHREAAVACLAWCFANDAGLSGFGPADYLRLMTPDCGKARGRQP